MGGRPLRILLSAGVPAGCQEKDVEDMIEGLKKGCACYDLRLAGGDTVFSPEFFFFDISILGSVEKGSALKREGAMKGDSLVLFGECGGSMAGLWTLGEIFDTPEGNGMARDFMRLGEKERDKIKEIMPALSTDTTMEDIAGMAGEKGLNRRVVEIIGLIKQHLVPRAVRVNRKDIDSRGLKITAMTDISDGIAEELASLCGASGTGALIDLQAIPVPSFLATGQVFGEDQIERVSLASGEEYSQMAAISGLTGGTVPEGAAVIGELTDPIEGMKARGYDGKKRKIVESGYEHDFQ